jgi:hypothetical protein
VKICSDDNAMPPDGRAVARPANDRLLTWRRAAPPDEKTTFMDSNARSPTRCGHQSDLRDPEPVIVVRSHLVHEVDFPGEIGAHGALLVAAALAGR